MKDENRWNLRHVVAKVATVLVLWLFTALVAMAGNSPNDLWITHMGDAFFLNITPSQFKADETELVFSELYVGVARVYGAPGNIWWEYAVTPCKRYVDTCGLAKLPTSNPEAMRIIEKEEMDFIRSPGATRIVSDMIPIQDRTRPMIPTVVKILDTMDNMEKTHMVDMSGPNSFHR